MPYAYALMKCALNSAAALDPGHLAGGLSTASAGNMARAVAWVAQRHGVPATALVPDSAPAAKLEPVRALGATVVMSAADRKRMGGLLTKLGQRTQALGVTLVYHNHMGNLGERPEELGPEESGCERQEKSADVDAVFHGRES